MYIRPRRNRKSDSVRRLVQETHLSTNDFVLPLFIKEGSNIDEQISSLPIASRKSLDNILKEIENCLELGIHAFMLFPKIEDLHKDAKGTYGYNVNNYYLRAAAQIKTKFPEITLISDVALDPYSIHGHDGIVQDGKILNDETLEVLGKISIAQAEAGFDILGPSDMMDGRVGYMRQTLDHYGYKDISIMSYTAKYASAYYGPFRDALDSAPVDAEDIPKDKKTYQMNPANKKEAITEAFLDIEEGADMIMVKPALNYLDIIHLLKQEFETPIAAYHVSGECSMLLAAADKGWLDLESAMQETLLSIKRAGTDIIITYFAKKMAQLLDK